eukprot:TRINITY_DN10506_c0_g1_i2.p1 TRINITY_DN10506_c0_g1~~TRINITY_DN10506_c0_g1_i2.p1  ORF type:complete len:544 (+),score=114.88 TRINITY_DN10506_c0_g1_i2:55-1686(+)
MRSFLLLSQRERNSCSYWVLLLVALTVTLVSSWQAAAKQPHIVWFVADDLGWDDLSLHGSPQIPTPNIDALAKEGIILNNYYTHPICTPSRSAFMTGLYAFHTGMQHSTIFGMQPYGLPLNLTLLPQHLKELGYSANMVGKWHLGFYQSAYTPQMRGFDNYFGYWNGKEDYFSHVADEINGNSNFTGLDLRGNWTIEDQYDGVYGPELFTEKAIEYCNFHAQNNPDQPMFLYFAQQSVHAANANQPLQAPQQFIDMFNDTIEMMQRRIFAGMVTVMDQSVANLTAALKANGMWENTLFIFTSDNGGPTDGMDGNMASNYPLRGRKESLWEGGVHVTAFINAPFLENQGFETSALMHAVDWFPTLISLAGGSVDTNGAWPLDGMDVWSAITTEGAVSPRYEMMMEIDPIKNISAIRRGDWKLLFGNGIKGDSDWYPRPSSNSTATVVDCGPVPPNVNQSCNFIDPCLYNITADPCEYHNLASENPDVVEELLSRIDYYKSTMVPPANQPNDPAANPALHGGVWVPFQDPPMQIAPAAVNRQPPS